MTFPDQSTKGQDSTERACKQPKRLQLQHAGQPGLLQYTTPSWKHTPPGLQPLPVDSSIELDSTVSRAHHNRRVRGSHGTCLAVATHSNDACCVETKIRSYRDSFFNLLSQIFRPARCLLVQSVAEAWKKGAFNIIQCKPTCGVQNIAWHTGKLPAGAIGMSMTISTRHAC